jgi:hypothetical protein
MLDDLISAPHSGNYCIFLSGLPGSGKTTLAVHRLRSLLEVGVPAEQVLVLVPQRTLAQPYFDAVRSADLPAGGTVDVVTLGGLARRALDLFWPLVGETAGFAEPDRPPRFLTLETAQYHLNRIVNTFRESGAFDGITIPRGRLVSQIIDNLNKAAAIGFPPDEIALRLKGAWAGESARLRIYDQVEAAALSFRQNCLEQSLLDWSLQIEVFGRHLLPLPQLRRYLLGGYRHLIADNTEEDIPVAHDLLKLWLPLCESALVIHDTDGGYRIFLGADPEGALDLSSLCTERAVLGESHISSPEIATLGSELAGCFGKEVACVEADAVAALVYPSEPLRFYPDMLDWVANQISRLVHEEGKAPGEIAVLAPILGDALRFSLGERLSSHGIGVRTHRPSRELREEPAACCLLTLAKIAHPAWQRPPPVRDVAQALARAITDLDPVRAKLLADIVYRVRREQPSFTPFFQIVPGTQERISYLLGARYDELRQWIGRHIDRTANGAESQKEADSLDHFFARLFGEVLSQVGFGFHGNSDDGEVAANLIESARKFRQSWVPGAGNDIGPEYVNMVEQGVVAAQYVSSWQLKSEDAVLLLPAHTFLMMNQPVSVQLWLDAGSQAWSERIYQPLTHPYVLRRDWPQGRVWADEDEVRVQQEALARLILGLTRRCRERIFLAFSELNERGYEHQGPLLQAVQQVLRRRGAEVR